MNFLQKSYRRLLRLFNSATDGVWVGRHLYPESGDQISLLKRRLRHIPLTAPVGSRISNWNCESVLPNLHFWPILWGLMGQHIHLIMGLLKSS